MAEPSGPVGLPRRGAPPGEPPADPSGLAPGEPHRHASWRFLREHPALALALLALGLIAAGACGANVWVVHDPLLQHRAHLLTPPAWQAGGLAAFPLGTDELGRDLLARLAHGARLSLGIALASVLLALLPGVALGFLAVVYPRLLSPLVMRTMDVLLALPGLLLAIGIIAVLGPGLLNTVIAIAIGSLPGYVRLARACALAEWNREHVVASRMVGSGTWRLLTWSILPNCAGPLIVHATLNFSSALLETAALGFLGLGVPAPAPEWGSMLSAGRDYLERAPWVVLLPGMAILVTALSINLLGDGLRDLLDPRLRGAS